MNIDGVRKSQPKKPIQIPQRTAPRPIQEILSPLKHRRIHLLHSVDRKQLLTIAVTFVMTFAFSIATSQGLASFSRPQQTAPDDSAQTSTPISITNQPQVLSLGSDVLTKPGEVYLPMEKISLPDPLKERKAFLEKYLRAKGSPLADHVSAISEQSQWKLIIAISRAESSFCKHQVTNNCWGIGGAWNMKNYKSFDQAVADVNRILEEHYIQAGLNTPKKIVKKYVGHQSNNWQTAVEQELDNLSGVR